MNKITLLFYFLVIQISAQTGISVSPPRVYFESAPGVSSTQTVTVSNVSEKHTLDLAISLGDWNYDEKGDNIIQAAGILENSCASWININKNDNYFSLGPGEKKELEITLTSPALPKDKLSVHTAVLFVSQMNPVDDVDSKGAKIKLSVRSGIKIFHKTPEVIKRKVEIKDLKFDASKKLLNITFENQSDTWTDGKLITDIINTNTGKKTSIAPIVFYTLPRNTRKISIPIQDITEKGSYNASVIIDYGDNETLEMGELNFEYE